MMRFLRKIGQRGVVTLPSELREAMELHDGDYVEFEVVGIVRREARKETDPVDASTRPTTHEA